MGFKFSFLVLCTRGVAKPEVLLLPTDRSAMVLCSFLFSTFGFSLRFRNQTRKRPRSERMDTVARKAFGARERHGVMA